MSEGSFIADEVKRRVGFAGRGDVGEGQGNAGDHLNHEGAQRGTAEDIPPLGVRRHEMPRRLADYCGKTGAVVHPIPDTMVNFFQNQLFGDGNGRRLNLHVAIFHAHGIARQGQRRRPGGDRAVLIINSAVARTHEQVGFSQPANRTTEMCAIDGKSDEGVGVHATQPRRAASGHTRPWQRRGVFIFHCRGFADFEGFDFSDRTPDFLRALEKRRENEADRRHRQNQRTDSANGETQSREKFSPRKFRR